MGVEVSLETPLALAAAPLAFPGSEAVNEAYALVQTQESLVAAAMQQRAHIAEQLLKLSEAAAAAEAAAASVKGGKGGKGGAAPPVAAEPAADEPSKSAEELQAELDAVDQTLGPLEAELQRLRGKALATWSTTVAEAMQHDVATRANMYADGLRDSLDWLNQQRYGALERKMSSMHPPASTAGSMGWSVQLSGRRVPVLFGEHVTDTAGTGLVHTAPGHGPEDFAVGQAHGLASACPVDEHGRFTRDTDEAVPFVGLHVLKEGNAKVLEALTARGALVHVERYLHRYPYDWLNYDDEYLHMIMIGYDHDYDYDYDYDQ
jgi:hypothetical protein